MSTKRTHVSVIVVSILSLIGVYFAALLEIDAAVRGGSAPANLISGPLTFTAVAVAVLFVAALMWVFFWPKSTSSEPAKGAGTIADEEAESKLSSVINSFDDAFAVEDVDGKLVTVNSAFSEMLCLSEMEIIGKDADFLINQLSELVEDPEMMEPLVKMAGEDQLLRKPEEIVLAATPKRTLVCSVDQILDNDRGTVGRVWKFIDISEKRRLEKGLCVSQKMESVGQLALGVAHDFNNLLTGINGNLAIVEMELESRRLDLPERKNLRYALQAGLRAGELVKQLLGFSRSDDRSDDSFCANKVMEEVKGIMSASIDPSITIRTELEKELWNINGDPNLVSQCLINMATNSRDALSGGGLIWLGTANCNVTAEQAGKMENGRVGDFVRLTVEDNGEGIPVEVLDHIFEQFFTTKEKGKGTGLGLATSLDIINRLGGWLQVESKEAKGTRFDIYLPKGDDLILPVEESPIPKLGKQGGQETILIVDDEEVVRKVAAALLKRLGYHILTASNGLEALEIFDAQGASIDLVLLDLTMPKLSGQDTFARLRVEYKFVPVLICSGYLLDLTAFREATGHCPEGFVQKPYQIDAMAASVRNVLDKAAAA